MSPKAEETAEEAEVRARSVHLAVRALLNEFPDARDPNNEDVKDPSNKDAKDGKDKDRNDEDAKAGQSAKPKLEEGEDLRSGFTSLPCRSTFLSLTSRVVGTYV